MIEHQDKIAGFSEAGLFQVWTRSSPENRGQHGACSEKVRTRAQNFVAHSRWFIFRISFSRYRYHTYLEKEDQFYELLVNYIIYYFLTPKLLRRGPKKCSFRRHIFVMTGNI